MDPLLSEFYLFAVILKLSFHCLIEVGVLNQISKEGNDWILRVNKLFDIDGGSKDILEIYNLYGWVWGSHWEMRWKTCKMFLSGKEGNEKKKAAPSTVDKKMNFLTTNRAMGRGVLLPLRWAQNTSHRSWSHIDSSYKIVTFGAMFKSLL